MSEPELLKFARGDATGLAIPAHGEALRASGEAFLTEAFRAFGSLARTTASRPKCLDHELTEPVA
jgi:hypothetical protein